MDEIACAHRELTARVYDVAHHVNRLISDTLDVPRRFYRHVQGVAHVDNQILDRSLELAAIRAGQQHVIHKDDHVRHSLIIHRVAIRKRYQKLRSPLTWQRADQQSRVRLARIDASMSGKHLAPQIHDVRIATIMLKKSQKECFVDRGIAFLQIELYKVFALTAVALMMLSCVHRGLIVTINVALDELDAIQLPAAFDARALLQHKAAVPYFLA